MTWFFIIIYSLFVIINLYGACSDKAVRLEKTPSTRFYFLLVAIIHTILVYWVATH